MADYLAESGDEINYQKNLGVNPSTVQRITELFLSCGSVSKRPYPRDATRPMKILTDPIKGVFYHFFIIFDEIFLSLNSLH